MCGIIGQLAFSDAEIGERRENIIRQLTPLMARRGPDDEGVWSDGQCCSLGVRRLAVLDPSPAGHQPMLTEDKRYALVYNGELYNFRELRLELRRGGVQFRSHGDTEVVLYALARWGLEALSRFNGMFALGFYDSVGKRLFLARDHAGIKPLYYALAHRGLVFASQYDPILAHPWNQGLEISPQALGLYLRLGYIPAPYALLRNTHMLEPGSWLEITGERRVQHGKFFEFPVYREPDLRGEEAYEAVDAALTAAVRRQLVSDVPVGTFLSGGIDSPLVAAKMCAASNRPVPAFTIGMNDDLQDETPDALTYARELGVEHYVECISPDHASAMIGDVVAACGEPFADFSIFPTMMVAAMARRHVTVMLSGDGGDELFWGYVGRFATVLEKVAGSNGGMNLKKLLAVNAGQRDSRWPRSIGDLYRLGHCFLSDGWLQRILPDLPDWPSDCALFSYDGSEPGPTAQWLRWNEFTSKLAMILLKVDRASMYHSLEVRVPLLDREVVQIAQRVEWSSCLDVKRRVGKIPLRHALARHVRHQTQTKRGFAISIDAWLRGPLRATFEQTVLGQPDLLGLPLNQKALRELFARHLSGQANNGNGLWMLLSLVLWKEQHYNGRRADSMMEANP
jgi:asparagine synthase (glutamine-hydrolysing)